jgi:hypothetical protein
MNPLGSADRFFAAAERAQQRAKVEDLVAEIADALAAAGEYVTRVDLEPTQRVVDFNWAAHQAARRLGIRVQVEITPRRAASDAVAQVRVCQRSPLA